MNASIYEYLDYKAYIIDLINNAPDGSRGKRKLLAEFIGCQVSYITGVLKDEAHFSSEQAEAACRFFGLSKNETEYLILLVQLSRSGTHKLKDFYKELIKQKQNEYSKLKSRLQISKKLKTKQETQYYQSWVYSAVYTLVSIPHLNTRDAIAKKLNEPIEKINKVLNFLVDAELLIKENQAYIYNEKKNLHLDKGSPLIVNHHTNWRLRTIKEFDQQASDSLHYSSALTLSKKDYIKVKEIFTKSLSSAVDVIKDSKEEELAVLCMDFYKL